MIFTEEHLFIFYMVSICLSCIGLSVMFWHKMYNRRIGFLNEDNAHLRERIEDMSGIDPLTDFPNRSKFFQLLDREIELANSTTNPFAVLHIDIDAFKHINDTIGHVLGDKFIKEISVRLIDSVPDTCIVSRIGGDEFGVIIPNIVSINSVKEQCDVIINALRVPIDVGMTDNVSATVSIGVAIFPHDATSSIDLSRYADMSVYAAKNNGKNRYEMFSLEMGDNFVSKQAISRQLKQDLVLHNRNLRVVYQPKINALDGTVVGMESLVRWEYQGHPCSPAKFIPIAEETGLVTDIGRFVLRHACRFERHLIAATDKHIPISVNVAPEQLNDKFVDDVREIAANTGLRFSDLQLEVTETSFMSNRHQAIQVLEQLRNMGVTVALDDFGTGWSNLAYLVDFPVDVLKIDKSFADLIGTKDDTRIIDAIISMADALGLSVVAEGVETKQQLDYLTSAGVDTIQGYYFSKPLTDDDFINYTLQHSPRNK